MRFGLPSETEVVSSDWWEVKKQAPTPSAVYLNKPTIDSLLAEALSQLELRNISKHESQQIERAEALKSDYDSRAQKTNRDLELLDSSYQHILRSQESVVVAILEEELKRRKEEERRREELRIQKEKEEKLRKEQEEKERQRKLEEERKRKELEQQKKEAERQEQLRLKKEKEQAESMKSHSTNFVEVDKEFRKWSQEIINIKEKVVAPINGNKDLKKSISALRRKITVKFGQLSNSQAHCQRIYSDIEQLIELVKSHPQGYPWLLNSIAKAIIQQAEAEVTVKPTAALPLAYLTNHLLRRYKEFDYYLTARFVKKCCFVIGFTCSIDTEEGRKRMGWKRHDDKWEDEVKYEERVGGIMSLWSAISRDPSLDGFKYFSRGSQWTCLARILNTKAELISNVHYVIVSNWWEIASQAFYGSYRAQARKIFSLIQTKWTEIGKLKSLPAATRLQILVEECWQGNFNTIKEMER